MFEAAERGEIVLGGCTVARTTQPTAAGAAQRRAATLGDSAPTLHEDLGAFGVDDARPKLAPGVDCQK